MYVRTSKWFRLILIVWKCVVPSAQGSCALESPLSQLARKWAISSQMFEPHRRSFSLKQHFLWLIFCLTTSHNSSNPWRTRENPSSFVIPSRNMHQVPENSVCLACLRIRFRSPSLHKNMECNATRTPAYILIIINILIYEYINILIPAYILIY